MKLSNLLKRLEYEVIQGTKEIEIEKVIVHSKDAAAGALFVCITGSVFNGADYIEEAKEGGAVAVVTEKEPEAPKDITVIKVADTRIALAEISAAFYGYPAKELTVVGVTGTKGKTTVSCMIYETLKQAGIKAGLIGTIEVRTGARRIPAVHTSPEALDLQKYLREMKDAGCEVAVMEVSSQGLKLHRVEGIWFDIGVFTNLGADHIGGNEHRDFEEYKSCKARLFEQCEFGILNGDSPYWAEMLPAGGIIGKETFGFQNKLNYIIKDVELVKNYRMLGVTFGIEKDKEETKIFLPMPGEFNAYNGAAAFAVCVRLGVSKETIQKALATMRVRGRVERVEAGCTIIIDYAHNAMSLQSVLKMVHSYHPTRIICVFGCGGNRAKERRYAMGSVSGKMADLTIVTSDNPRDEDPYEIMQDIRSGIEKAGGAYVEICDRKEAVRYAVELAKEGDVILLAGKGHEDYQEIRGKKYHMDDREIVREIIEEVADVRRHYH